VAHLAYLAQYHQRVAVEAVLAVSAVMELRVALAGALVFKEPLVAQEIHQALPQAKEMLEEEDKIPLHFRVVVVVVLALLVQRGL